MAYSSKSKALLLSLNLLFFTFFNSIPSSESRQLLSCDPELPEQIFGNCRTLVLVLIFGVRIFDAQCCPYLGDIQSSQGNACTCTALKGGFIDKIKEEFPEVPIPEDFFDNMSKHCRNFGVELGCGADASNYAI
ncbi:hypothetical protein OWV82_022315 [Melia azedarach]|uniref:Uncharacterized protein n=1 Tax=Melia azedarach TaxID=155640 RepID=A0ACC1X323_MELAZ|nr:hypothetical protein OWV82_022315 [Melia azedarach]